MRWTNGSGIGDWGLGIEKVIDGIGDWIGLAMSQRLVGGNL